MYSLLIFSIVIICNNLTLFGCFADAVFGCALEDQFDTTNSPAPPVVVKCVQELEERAAQLSEYQRLDQVIYKSYLPIWNS